MVSDIAKDRYLEYGHHELALYGTKIDVVCDIIKNGKIPILDIETPVSCEKDLYKFINIINFRGINFRDW